MVNEKYFSFDQKFFFIFQKMVYKNRKPISSALLLNLMLPITKKKKKNPDAHSTSLMTPDSPIILGRNDFFENHKNRKE